MRFLRTDPKSDLPTDSCPKGVHRPSKSKARIGISCVPIDASWIVAALTLKTAPTSGHGPQSVILLLIERPMRMVSFASSAKALEKQPCAQILFRECLYSPGIHLEVFVDAFSLLILHNWPEPGGVHGGTLKRSFDDTAGSDWCGYLSLITTILCNWCPTRSEDGWKSDFPLQTQTPNSWTDLITFK